MPKRHKISLLNLDERGKRRRFEPTLRITLGSSTAKPLSLEKVPPEIRNQIYSNVFEGSQAVAEPEDPTDRMQYIRKPFVPEPEPNVRSDGQYVGPEGADRLGKTRPLTSADIAKTFGNDFVVDTRSPLVLHRFPAGFLAEVEKFLFDECTLKLRCEERLYPRDREVLSQGQRLVVLFKGRPAIFVEKVLPLLEERHSLKYLHIYFTTWPRSLKAEGKYAARLLRSKLEFLTNIKADNVVLDVYLPHLWKHKVLQNLADVMMGVEGAEEEDPTADIPVKRAAPVVTPAAATTITTTTTTAETRNKKGKPGMQGPEYAYNRVKGRAHGFIVGSRFGSF